MRTTALSLQVLTVGVCLAAAGPAFGQSDPAAAQRLFQEAEKLMGQADEALSQVLSQPSPDDSIAKCDKKSPGDARCRRAAELYGSACEKLEASYRLEQVPITLYKQGVCYDLVDRRASAWQAFDNVKASPLPGSGAAYAERRAAELLRKLPRLTITVGAQVLKIEGLRVIRVTKRGDAEASRGVEKAEYGSPTPVDGGVYKVVVEALGYRKWESAPVTVPNEVAPGTPAFELDVKGLEIDPSSARSGTAPAGPAWRTPLGVSLGVIGVLGLGVGAVMGWLALENWDDVKKACPGVPKVTVCNDDIALGKGDDAGTFANVATGGFVAGGVAAAGGLFFLVIHPLLSDGAKSAPSPGPAVTVAPAAGRAYTGVVVTGSF